jgi:hypothetical protein
MEYRKQLEQTMGQTLPAYEDDQDEVMMSPEMEVKVSQMAAQAGQMLLQQHQQEAQQAKNAQAAADPLLQLQQQELQIKQGELQRKSQKDITDMQAKMAQIDVELKRIEAQQETEGAKLALQAQNNKEQRDHQHTSEGFRAKVDMVKQNAQLQQQREMQAASSAKKGE